MAGKDLMEKTLEAHNDVFADIVNGLMFEGRPVVSQFDLSDAQPTSFYKSEGALREQERDCAKFWKRAQLRIALFGMENQTRYEPRMPLRVIGYDGAAYRAQLDEPRLYPVITLVLYFGNTRWGNRSLHQALDFQGYPPEIRRFTGDYHINVFEIAFLTDEQIDRFHSDFRIVADYFAHRRTNPDYRPTNPQKFVHVNELLKLMSAITHDERYQLTCNSEGGAPKNMDELLNKIEARGEQRGIEIGEQRGIEIGKQRGIVIGEQRGEQRGIVIGEQRGIGIGELRKARTAALGIRAALGISDPELVSKAVGIEAELIERWFAEEPVKM